MAQLGDLQENQMGKMLKNLGKISGQVRFVFLYVLELVLGYHNYLLELSMYLPKKIKREKFNFLM